MADGPANCCPVIIRHSARNVTQSSSINVSRSRFIEVLFAAVSLALADADADVDASCRQGGVVLDSK
eukprot:scaffold206579_cov62-Attheya_sp.AAC.2